MGKRVLFLLLVISIFLVACTRYEPEGAVGFVQGEYAIVTRGQQVHVVEIARPDRPRWVADFEVPGRAMKTEVHGNYAYIIYYPPFDVGASAQNNGGLLIVDISSPKRPEIAGDYPMANLANDLAVNGNLVYLVDWEGLRVLDVGDPSNPLEIAAIGEGKNALTIVGDYLYGAWGSCSIRTGYCFGGIGIADVSTPTDPVWLDTYPVEEIPGYAITVQEDIAYVAGKGLWQADVSDKENVSLGPIYVLVGEGHYQSHVAVAGDYAYLVTDKGLRVMDINSPEPGEIALLPMTGYVDDMVLRGKYAYLVGNEGLHIIDLNDPKTPFVIGYYSGAS